MRESQRQFWLLVRLRYKLIWAHARTSKGRMAMAVALYLLGTTLFVFILLGGIDAAVDAARSGRGENVARWVFTGLFINAIALSIVFGAGPRSVFSEQSLRKFPLTSNGRFIARHLTGLLDPVWPI